MADFTQTITNQISLFGGSSTNKWNDLVWGTDVWAFDGRVFETDLNQVDVLNDTLTLTDTWSRLVQFNLSLSNSILINPRTINTLELSDAAGYKKVFVGGTSDADDRTEVDYEQVTVASTSYSEVTVNSIVWVEQ